MQYQERIAIAKLHCEQLLQSSFLNHQKMLVDNFMVTKVVNSPWANLLVLVLRVELVALPATHLKQQFRSKPASEAKM